jgi:hypothetical protein
LLYNYRIVKRYWPLLFIVLILATVIGVSQYAETTKQHCEESARQTEAATVAKGDDGKASNNAEDACKPPVWARYVAWPEGVGAWAVILTLLVIGWQSIETRAAAKATEDSVGTMKRQADIQAAAMSQWLDVEFVASDTAGSELTDELGNFVPSFEAKLHFKAINNSAYPLTVKRAEISISRNHYDGKMRWENFAIEETAILPPAGKGKESAYHFFIRLGIEGAGVESYARDSYFASVVGNVFFEPVIADRIVDQRFGSIARCGPSGATFTGYWSKEAVSTGTEEYQPER